MSAHHHTAAANRRARAARAQVVLPTQCWRCGGIIDVGQHFDMGHVVDVAAGGADSALYPEHRRCNRHAGQLVGVQAKQARAARPSSPSW